MHASRAPIRALTRGDSATKELNEAVDVPVEGELLPHAPHRIPAARHLRSVGQRVREGVHVVEEHADLQLPRQRLSRHDGVAVVWLEQRQPRGRIGPEPRWKVQVVPHGTPQIAAVRAPEDVQPGRVVA